MGGKSTRITANITARIDQLKKRLDEGAKELDTFAAKAEKLSKRASAVGEKMTQRMTLPILAAGGASIKFASDLGEAISKSQVLFGDSAKDIEEWADGAALAFGQSKRQAIDAASGFKQIFDDWPEGEATEASKDLTVLASDLASFNNASVDDVLGALEAGLRGEAEPLRKFGVNLTAATLEAKALELGLMEQGEAMSESAKEHAAMAIIMESTTSAQGDFAATSDGAANKTKILKAQAEDLAAKFGGKLLPAAVKVLGWASGMIEKLSALDSKWQNVILVAAGFAAAVGPVLLVVGAMTKHVNNVTKAAKGLSKVMSAMAASPMVLLALAVAALVLGLVILYKKNEKFRTTVQKLAKYMKEHLGPVLSDMAAWFGEKLPPAIERAKSGAGKLRDFFMEKVLPVLKTIGGFIVDHLIPAAIKVGTAFFDAATSVGEAIAAVITTVAGLPGKINEKATAFYDAAKGLGKSILNGLADALSSAVGFAGSVADGVLAAIKKVVNGVIDRINRKLEFTIDLGFGKSYTVDAPDIKRLATGSSFFSGGPVRVGENGAETVVLPEGSQVIPNHSLGGSGNGGTNVYVETNANPHEIAREIEWAKLTDRGVLV